jgi:hypothetical protein
MKWEKNDMVMGHYATALIPYASASNGKIVENISTTSRG